MELPLQAAPLESGSHHSAPGPQPERSGGVRIISPKSMKLPCRILVTTVIAALALPIAAQAAKGERKKKEPTPSFTTVDKDGDGKISESEFAAAHEKLGAEAAKTQFAQLDKDHDGKLSKEEFGSGDKRGERKKARKKK